MLKISCKFRKSASRLFVSLSVLFSDHQNSWERRWLKSPQLHYENKFTQTFRPPNTNILNIFTKF